MRARGDAQSVRSTRPRSGGLGWRLDAEGRWAAQRLSGAYERRCVIPKVETPSQTPDRHSRVRITRDLAVPMHDGVVLRADVYSPAQPGRLPVVLIRMPYGKDRHYYMAARGKFWARKGYHCVIQDVRGRWRSGGAWEPLANEAQDGYDTLDWVAAQPWCDGAIGMAGESYYGMTQWAVAPLNHPNLRCIAPGDTSCDMYEVVHPGGAFTHATMGLWAWVMTRGHDRDPHRFDPWHLPLISSDEAAGAVSEDYKDYVRHWRRDEWWDARRLSRGHADVRIPVLHWGGWYDVLLNGTLSHWAGMEAAASPEVRRTQRLMIAPTDHAFTPTYTGRIGRLEVSPDGSPFDQVQHFFDYWLRGEQNGVAGSPRIRLYDIGGNEWRQADEWPPSWVTPTSLYLHGRGRAAAGAEGGALSPAVPDDEPQDRYVYDPADPVTYWLGRDLWGLAGQLDDRSALERRQDVLVYSSDVLPADLAIMGPLSAELFASSSCPDTDFTAALVDVYPDGFAQLVQEGVLRARFRDSYGEESFLEPDQPVRLQIDMWAAGHTFRAGHKVRLEVSSSNFGRWDRNLNSGRLLGTEVEGVSAVNTIYHDRAHPSRLVLPVVGDGVAVFSP